MKVNLKLKFFIVAVIVSAIIAGVFLPQIVSPILDNNEAIHPLLASLVYYGFLFVIFGAFAYAFTGKFTAHTVRLTIVLYLIYLLFDFYEPPLIVSPEGTIVQTTGWRSSLDYSMGYTIRQVVPSLSWKDVYNIEIFLIPMLISAGVIFLSTPQLLGKALREVK